MPGRDDLETRHRDDRDLDPAHGHDQLDPADEVLPVGGVPIDTNADIASMARSARAQRGLIGEREDEEEALPETEHEFTADAGTADGGGEAGEAGASTGGDAGGAGGQDAGAPAGAGTGAASGPGGTNQQGAKAPANPDAEVNGEPARSFTSGGDSPAGPPPPAQPPAGRDDDDDGVAGGTGHTWSTIAAAPPPPAQPARSEVGSWLQPRKPKA